jgi:hypothetical protein
MGQAQKKESKKIADYYLNLEQIRSGQFPRDEIYEITVDGRVFGPFWQEDLKDFLKDAQLFNNKTTVKRIDEQDWVKIYDHPFFQRRKPELVSEDKMIVPDDGFYIMNDGQKEGPYKKREIELMIQEHMLLITHTVSCDNGQSWGKVWEIEEFDRRITNGNILPTVPENDVFNESKQHSLKVVEQKNENLEREAVIGLAYIGQKREGKNNVDIDGVLSSKSQGSNVLATVGTLIFFMLSLTVGYFTLFNDSKPQEQMVSKAKKIKSIRAKRAPAARKVKKKKMAKVENKPVEKRILAKPTTTSKRKGRTLTKGTKKIKTQDFIRKREMKAEKRVEVPPEAIFDETTEVFELQPIRRRLSKEVTNPENDMEMQDGAYDDMMNNGADFDVDPFDAQPMDDANF